MIKKIIMFISIGAMFFFQACYDDYKVDFDYTTTYFPRQFPLRTLVVEEGKDLTFEVGAVLGGKYSNDTTEELSFVVQDTFLNADNFPDYTMLPEDYYTLESQNITIPSGKFKGNVTVTLDKDKFLNDDLAIGNNYALPLEIVGASTDSILADKHYTVIVLRYYNQYHGWYYTKGVDDELDGTGSPIAEEKLTYQFSDLVTNADLLLTTTSKNGLTVPYNGVKAYKGSATDTTVSRGNFEISLEINTDNSVSISGDDNNGITNISGSGTYDPVSRNFNITYSYTDADAAEHAVTEELLYRNTELVLEEWQ